MVNRTERGWAGHYCCSQSCLFRRNTLLEKDGLHIVVSSVGNMFINGNREKMGCDRFYETLAFYSDENDTRFFDADVSRSIHIDVVSHISKQGADDSANDMHESVVAELAKKLEAGEL